METEKEIRSYIRKIITEEINNFLKKELATATKQLEDNSKPTEIGDPFDVKLNQMANELGSDGENAPTVSVKAGAVKGGSKSTAGQHQANFDGKTKQAK